MAQDGATTFPSVAESNDARSEGNTSELTMDPEGNLTPKRPPKPEEEAATDSLAAADPPRDETPEDPTQEINTANNEKKEDAVETATDATLESEKHPEETATNVSSSSGIIVSTSKKSRPPYKFDPDKITLRFLFANRDGLTVTVECKPSDTVGEVKGALISVWPEDMPDCDSGENLRLVCMGKGYLTPDTRTLEECQIPVFKTHPTPVNVSVKPREKSRFGDGSGEVKKKGGGGNSADATAAAGAGRAGIVSAPSNALETGQGCCAIL